VQAHTLGEVGILGTVLLRVSYGTILPIFIASGSYLTDKQQKMFAQIFRHVIVGLRTIIHTQYAKKTTRKHP